MKLILPLFICVFITGCTIPNFPIQTQKNTNTQKTNSSENFLSEVKKEKENAVFSTKYDIHKEHVYSNLNNTIIDIANQLFDTKANKKIPTRVILTTFVDLDSLEETSTFGRLISESMFNELQYQ